MPSLALTYAGQDTCLYDIFSMLSKVLHLISEKPAFFWFWFSISTHAYDILPKSEIIINLFLHKLVYLHYWNEKEWTSNTGSNMDETKMHYKKAT